MTMPTNPPVASARAREKTGWRCFHCGEHFTEERCARLHFGRSEDSTPACIIKGAEEGLLEALRRTEEQADDAIQAMHEESTDAARAFHQQRCRHTSALIHAEQFGYDRGLADGRAEATQLLDEIEGRVKRLQAIIAEYGDLIRMANCSRPEWQQEIDEALRGAR